MAAFIYHASLSSRPLPPNMPLCPYIGDHDGFLSKKVLSVHRVVAKMGKDFYVVSEFLGQSFWVNN
jgi:hypothetical protein